MTTASTRRKVGRPPGSSRLNEGDARLCEMVANKMLADGALSIRAAILQVISPGTLPHLRNATLRRLQGKFKPDIEMAAARERAAAEARAQKASMDGWLSILDFVRGGPNFQRFAVEISPMLQALQAAQFAVRRELLPPMMQVMKQLQDAGVFGPRLSKEAVEMLTGPRLSLLPPPYGRRE